MFDSLSTKLDAVFKKLSKKGMLREDDVKAGMKEIRIALLEADVNYKVVKSFIKTVEEKAVGEDVLKSLTPSQQIVRIVRDELAVVLGESSRINTEKNPAVVMLMGLQGSGKTTTSAKLGKMFLKDGKKPYLIAADLQRPAAIDQLIQLGKETGIGVYAEHDCKDVLAVVGRGIEAAKKQFARVIIIDTAGRLHVDEALMDEVAALRKAYEPSESLLVVDAMTGQDAVNVAMGFEDKIGIDGVIMTKLDGDARGGAALSLRMVVGKPIKYIGTGEKLDAFEPFHPDRLVSRILGMGDVLTLIEKAEEQFDEEEAKKMEQKLLKAEFNLEDFLGQIKMIRKMGPLSSLMKMVPGMPKDMEVDDSHLVRVESIIQSMTPGERRRPFIIKASRKKRIAKGSGRTVAEVNQLLRQFDISRKMMKNMGKLGKKGKGPMPGMFG